MRKFLIGVLIGMALYSSMMICKNNAERKYKDEIEEIKKIQLNQYIEDNADIVCGFYEE